MCFGYNNKLFQEHPACQLVQALKKDLINDFAQNNKNSYDLSNTTFKERKFFFASLIKRKLKMKITKKGKTCATVNIEKEYEVSEPSLTNSDKTQNSIQNKIVTLAKLPEEKHNNFLEKIINISASKKPKLCKIWNEDENKNSKHMIKKIKNDSSTSYM